MDKKTLIFVACLTLTFFFVNNFFNKKSPTPQQIELSPQQEQIAEKRKEREISLDQLPLVDLYEKANFEEFAAHAVSVNGHFITLRFSDDLPEELYAQYKGEFLPVKLSSKTEHINEPVVYSATTAPLFLAFPSVTGSQDLQLIDLDRTLSDPRAYLAEYAQGRLFFPLETPKKNSIALIQTDKGFVPYALFLADSKELRPLDAFEGFSTLVEVYRPKISYGENDQREQFFVLENEFQQLVFSNYGAALAEINLPFEEKSGVSHIHQINIDHTLQHTHAENDLFPALPYTIADGSGTMSIVENRSLGGYYPLLRRSIYPTGPRDPTFQIPPQYYGLNLISNEPGSGGEVYRVKQMSDRSITFESAQPHRRITKTFTMPKTASAAPYCFYLTVKVEGDARGLYLTSGIPEVELISGSFTPMLSYRVLKGDKGSLEKISPPKTATTFNSVQPDWILNSNGFFGLIIDPLTEVASGVSAFNVSGTITPTRLTLVDSAHDLYPVAKYPGYELQIPLKQVAQTTEFRIFSGPLEKEVLRTIDQTFLDPKTGYDPDYLSSQTMQGWFSFISEPFAQFLFILMNFFHTITGSWGISIILLTLALRIMLYPLNAWSIRSTLKMQQIAPKIKANQDKFKGDPKRLQAEMVALYRDAGVNPMTGCFPLLIQIPFLIGMFQLLKSTFELRGASFIPGWIDNLTAPDVLFSWGMPIPFFGTEFHLLPLVIGGVMYIQQKITTGGKTKLDQMSDQQKQQQKIGTIMTIVLAVMFYHFPSGLNLYWLSSMVLGIVQQKWMMKRMQSKLVNTHIKK